MELPTALVKVRISYPCTYCVKKGSIHKSGNVSQINGQSKLYLPMLPNWQDAAFPIRLCDAREYNVTRANPPGIFQSPILHHGPI